MKFRSHLSRGVTVGTMLIDEALHFIRIGTFLERADNTARLLDVKYHALTGLAGGEFFGPDGLRPIAEFRPEVHQASDGDRFWDRPGYCNNFLFVPADAPRG